MARTVQWKFGPSKSEKPDGPYIIRFPDPFENVDQGEADDKIIAEILARPKRNTPLQRFQFWKGGRH